MRLRLLAIPAVLVTALAIAGCGGVPPEDTTGSDAITNQVRVLEVGGSTLDGFRRYDTVQATITGDRLSIMGGGGTAPVVCGLALASTSTVGTYTGTWTPSVGVSETCTVVVDSSGVIASVEVARVGTGAGSFSASVVTKPTMKSGMSGVWTLSAEPGLTGRTGGSTATRMTFDAAGLLWWDLDGNPSTTDDVVMVVMQSGGTGLIGSATLLHLWDGDATEDLVTLWVQATVSSGAITRIEAEADPVLDALGASETWVDDATPTHSSASVPLFGPWSTSMAGHWLVMPTSGSTTVAGGSIATTRVETERDSAGNVLSTSINTSGDEAETVIWTYATEELEGYPVVKVTVQTGVDRVGSASDETTRYAVYYARASTGAIYRVGLWEDADYDNVIDTTGTSELTTNFSDPPIAFPASQPDTGDAYPSFTRWGIKTIASHLRSQTYHGDTGLAALMGDMSTATTTIVPSGFASLTGAGTNARLTTYWQPGVGVIGMRWGSGSAVVRQFRRSDGTYRQVARVINETADLVKP